MACAMHRSISVQMRDSSLRPTPRCTHRGVNRSLIVQCSKGGPAPSSPEGAPGKHPNKRGLLPGAKKARQPGLYEVRVVTPPPRSLGIYALPPNTQCGEEIDVEGSSYVVTTVVLQYKLRGGKYVRDHNRLDVQPTGRWLVNQMLEGLIKARYVGPTGNQD
ncbi:hypothetical protein PLESTB_000930500 [Pleodorina starrii]|uniref:Uncharacterized protein n=1 Tax=Pleodorina starrii TaxID=330485 RepID=A0A9W6BMR0_9CHLO|nr:hypothetical protein PLESTM_001554700 [Pleodorina starrii]GLC55007.1 hypothetical protein PLESTB_000930500 [Pleodorina starrii]GLC68428.1 hypothetical protein PLESTF_000690400 [Pleodorina starrii]